MTEPPQCCDVAVVGGGPAGLAAAVALRERGIDRVRVIERETRAGGIPRHCGHPPFGMREFGRVLTGPAYAERLVTWAEAAGVEVATSTTVTALLPGGGLQLSSNAGLSALAASRVILATGIRETPRSARLLGGRQLAGVMNTGALQGLVYLTRKRPFQRPLVVGSELVSFSALLTCRKAGIQPVAMIEENNRVTARWPCRLLPPLLGVPLMLNTRLTHIQGERRVEACRVDIGKGFENDLVCDGVLLTGRFTPESSLLRMAGLEIDADSGGPVIDQYGRCSDPAFFAAGNLLRPVETAGWSWREGRDCGNWVADDLQGELIAPEKSNDLLRFSASDPMIKLMLPQKVLSWRPGSGMKQLQLRFAESARGRLIARNGKDIVWQKRLNALPERRFLVPLSEILPEHGSGNVTFEFHRDGPA